MLERTVRLNRRRSQWRIVTKGVKVESRAGKGGDNVVEPLAPHSIDSAPAAASIDLSTRMVFKWVSAYST